MTGNSTKISHLREPHNNNSNFFSQHISENGKLAETVGWPPEQIELWLLVNRPKEILINPSFPSSRFDFAVNTIKHRPDHLWPLTGDHLYTIHMATKPSLHHPHGSSELTWKAPVFLSYLIRLFLSNMDAAVWMRSALLCSNWGSDSFSSGVTPYICGALNMRMYR